MELQIDKLKGPLMHEHRNYVKGPVYKVEYGALYNWYAATDLRNIAPVGWHVPTDEDWTTLIDHLGGSEIAGGPIKEAGLGHWSTPNTGATNISGLTSIPGGFRWWDEGLGGDVAPYKYMGLQCGYWSSDMGEGMSGNSVTLYNDNTNFGLGATGPTHGLSIRLIKDDAIDQGFMLDNDLHRYRTVKVGNQVWMGENLFTSHYRDGSEIPNITDSPTWDTLSTGAMCFYNNDSANGYQSGITTNNGIARWDGTGGRTIQDSRATISDDGEIFTYVGANKIGVQGSSKYVGVFGEAIGTRAYGVVGHSDYIPAQFCNLLKTVTGIRHVQVYRGDSMHLDGPVEPGYALREVYRLPVNDWTDIELTEVDAGAIDCIWDDVTTDLEASEFIFSLRNNGILKPAMKLSGNGKLYLRNSTNTAWNEIPSPDEIKIDINFLDLTPLVYNVPAAMKFTAQTSEGTAATLSIELNTNMARYDKLTITPTQIGLITLTGILL